jgi:antitoxin component of MazEF toxin-antitoxin module
MTVAAEASEPLEENTLEHFERQLSKGGGGTVLYLPAEVAREFHLEPGTPVSVDVKVVEGQLQITVEPHPRFRREEFLSLGEEEGWELVDDRDRGEGQWEVEFKTPETGTTVRANSRLTLGSHIVNNVFVESPTLPVESIKDYQRFRPVATANDLSIEVYDEEGLWERLATSDMLSPSDPPEVEEVEKFLDAAESISIAFAHQGSSLSLSVRDVKDWVDRVEEAALKAGV